MIYATVEDWLGWRNKKSSINSKALKKRQLAKFKQLESRATARRLTEINSRANDGGPPGDTMELQKTSTWGGLVRLANGAGGTGRFRSREPPGGGPVETV